MVVIKGLSIKLVLTRDLKDKADITGAAVGRQDDVITTFRPTMSQCAVCPLAC